MIFALRDPVGRMWSDYRFAAQWYQNKGWGFNQVGSFSFLLKNIFFLP